MDGRWHLLYENVNEMLDVVIFYFLFKAGVSNPFTLLPLKKINIFAMNQKNKQANYPCSWKLSQNLQQIKKERYISFAKLY